MSQLELALECGISARHLSFLETGRARPSRDMVLHLCEGLALPRTARNGLLQAAGFAALFPRSPLDGTELQPFRAVMVEMMARHAPWPAILCDRHWNVVDANGPAQALLAPMHRGGVMNVVRMITDSPVAEAMIENLPDMLEEMAGRLRLEVIESGSDPELLALRDGLYAALHRLAPGKQPATPRRPMVPLVVRFGETSLSFLTAVAQFGTSEDITVRDLRLELFFPADDATRAALQAQP